MKSLRGAELRPYSLLCVLSALALCACGKTLPPGPAVAKAIKKIDVIPHAGVTPQRIIARPNRLEHPDAVIKFDHRTIAVDSPLELVSISNDSVAKPESYFSEVHVFGPSSTFSRQFNSESQRETAPQPEPKEMNVRVGNWDHNFEKPVREVIIDANGTASRRDSFHISTEARDIFLSPTKFGIGTFRRGIEELHASSQESPLEAALLKELANAGYSRSMVRGTIQEIEAEFLKMTDREFLLQMLASDVGSLSNEKDLKSALRVAFLQTGFDVDSSFVMTINGQDAFILKSPNHPKRWPFRIYLSVIDAKGAETAWGGLLLQSSMSDQEIAERVAALFADDSPALTDH